MNDSTRPPAEKKNPASTKHQHCLRFFDASQELAKVGSWENSAADHKTYWSRELYALLGISPQAAVPQHSTFLARVHDEDRQRVEETYRQGFADGERHDISYRIVQPSGTIHHIRDRCEHQLDSDGKVLRSWGFLQDITELQETREALNRSRKEFDQFAHTASHDLQEPLRAIIGFLQLLENRYVQQLDEKGKEFIERSVNAGRRMELLIKELLNLARVNTRGAAFQDVELDSIFEDVQRRLLLMIEKKKAKITCTKLPALPVDSEQIATLFYHLIMNGLHYNTSEQPQVNIDCYRQDENYILSFADNGIGIDPQFHQRIFGVFQRLHTQREYLGVGMGLTMSKRIVERHGGAIWVESASNKGSVFYVSLPAS